MIRKIIENFAFVGIVLVLLGLFYWSVTGVWDWKAQAAVYVGAALVLVYLIANLSEIRALLTSRSARLGGTALVGLVLVLGILALLNFLNFRHHKRIDLSEGQLSAVSEQTRRVLDSLDQNIEVTAFFQDEAGAGRFTNLAKEYRYITPKFSYEVVDPQKDPSQVSLFDITRNGQVVVAGLGKREVIDDVNEEKLTNAIIKVTREEEKAVYFLTGHGERGLDDFEAQGYSSIKQAIEKQNYNVAAYNLAQENRLPEDATVLISAGPKVDFFPNEVALLEDFLAAGGKLLLLVDPESEFEMPDFLGRYGIALSKDFVVDASGLGQLFGFGAAAPLAADYASHPITEDLAGTMSIFPGARSVQTTESSLGYSTVELVKTSAQSWGESNIESESVSFDEADDRQGPVAIAVVSTKEVAGEAAAGSQAKDSENDEDLSAPDGAEDSASAGESADREGDSEEPQPLESRIVVFGDADFATNGYMETSINGDLFLNTVSWLAEDTDLLSIRPKDPESRTITMTGAEARLIFWASVVLFPLATLVFGVAVWYRRR